MAQVTVTISGKTYRMACDDGQEEHLHGLAARLDRTLDDLRRAVGEIGDQRLTVMSAITVLDQLSETERRLAAAEEALDAARENQRMLLDRQNGLEHRLAERVVQAAERIEALAETLSE